MSVKFQSCHPNGGAKYTRVYIKLQISRNNSLVYLGNGTVYTPCKLRAASGECLLPSAANCRRGQSYFYPQTVCNPNVQCICPPNVCRPNLRTPSKLYMEYSKTILYQLIIIKRSDLYSAGGLRWFVYEPNDRTPFHGSATATTN